MARKTRRGLFGVGDPGDASLWESTIAKFQEERSRLNDAESALYSVRELAFQTQADADEWQSNFNKVNAAMSAMDSIGGIASGISDWWDSITSNIVLNGVRRGGLAGTLGILPALPVSVAGLTAVIAGATAAVSAAYAFVAFINAKYSVYQQTYEDQISRGADPVTAADNANRIASDHAKRESGYSFGASLERVGLYAAIAAGLYLLASKR
jgi:hypothetical protein